MVKRGCGDTRIAGGVYLEVNLSPFGSPLEEFIVDPPVKLDMAALGITPIGMHFINGSLFDWVGSSHYPTPAHFVEEVRHHGLSRKIASTFDFSRITPQTEHLLIHAQAYVENWSDFDPRLTYCPTNNSDHGREAPQTICAGLWYMQADEDAAPGSGVCVWLPDRHHQFVCWNTPSPMEFAPAIFMRFKASRLVVIDHADQSLVEERVERASRSGLVVEVVGS